jgi:hypothetical protein
MSGYIGTQPVPQATQTRDAFTATAGQTSFATSGYTPDYLDVYLNGIKLAAADYTASNGSDVVLASGAALNDILEVVAYSSFEAAHVTGADFFTVTNEIRLEGDTGSNALVQKNASAGRDELQIYAGGDAYSTGSRGAGIHLYGNSDNQHDGNFAVLTGPNDNGDGRIIASGREDKTHVTIGNDIFDYVDDGDDHALLNLKGPSSQPALLIEGAGGTEGDIVTVTGEAMQFGHWDKATTTYTPRMEIDSSGSLLVGKTASDFNTQGFEINSGGQLRNSRASGAVAFLNRKTDNGSIVDFGKEGSVVGRIGTNGGTRIYIGSGDANITFNPAGNYLFPSTSTGGGRDNLLDLGTGGARFDDVYATNGSIQTSDANEKQDIASLTATEMLVAARISALFKTFRWIDSVTAKGANARTHTGVIAQDVQAAFIAEGLDAGDYALFTSATWWETQTDVPAVEADEDNDIEAADAYTRTDTYDTLDEAPAGATERTRMGIRYPELLAFVGAYNEQRFASIETRLAALEAV